MTGARADADARMSEGAAAMAAVTTAAATATAAALLELENAAEVMRQYAIAQRTAVQPTSRDSAAPDAPATTPPTLAVALSPSAASGAGPLAVDDLGRALAAVASAGERAMRLLEEHAAADASALSAPEPAWRASVGALLRYVAARGLAFLDVIGVFAVFGEFDRTPPHERPARTRGATGAGKDEAWQSGADSDEEEDGDEEDDEEDESVDEDGSEAEAAHAARAATAVEREGRFADEYVGILEACNRGELGPHSSTVVVVEALTDEESGRLENTREHFGRRPGEAQTDDDDDDDYVSTNGANDGNDDGGGDSDEDYDDDDGSGDGDSDSDSKSGPSEGERRHGARETRGAHRARGGASLVSSGDEPRGTRGGAASSSKPRRSPDDGDDDGGVSCVSSDGSDREEEEERADTVARVREDRPCAGDSLWVWLDDPTRALLQRGDGSIAHAQFRSTNAGADAVDPDAHSIAASAFVAHPTDHSIADDGVPRRPGRAGGVPGEEGDGVATGARGGATTSANTERVAAAAGVDANGGWIEEVVAAHGEVEAGVQREDAARMQLMAGGVVLQQFGDYRGDANAATVPSIAGSSGGGGTPGDDSGDDAPVSDTRLLYESLVAMPREPRGHMVTTIGNAGQIAVALDRLKAGQCDTQVETIATLQLIRSAGWVIHGPYPIDEQAACEARNRASDGGLWCDRLYATFLRIDEGRLGNDVRVPVAMTVLNQVRARAVGPSTEAVVFY